MFQGAWVGVREIHPNLMARWIRRRRSRFGISILANGIRTARQNRRATGLEAVARRFCLGTRKIFWLLQDSAASDREGSQSVLPKSQNVVKGFPDELNVQRITGNWP